MNSNSSTKLKQLDQPDSNIRVVQRRYSSTELSSETVKRLNQPINQQARIASLKAMTAALLRRIESLENDVATEVSLESEMRQIEAEIIRCTLIQTRGVQRQAARLLGMKMSTLHSKIKRYQSEFGSWDI